MIKDHGHLGLPPSTSYELLEKCFGEEFANAQIEPRDISNVYYKYGYKAATDCQDLLNRLLAAKKNDPRATYNHLQPPDGGTHPTEWGGPHCI